MTQDFTQDYLLGGKVTIRQPSLGYRVAIDPIFLAASIDAKEGESVLDVGMGVGAASLCLAYRNLHCKIVGLEVQREYVRMAAENIILNEVRNRVEVLHGDLLKSPPRLAAGTFSHVMANPPYLESTRSNTSLDIGKATANIEAEAKLEQWAKFCLLMVKPKGTVTFIHRADRLDHILSYFAGKMGEITVFPLWPGKGKPAKRVIVKGRKNSNAPMRLLPGLNLHEPDGSYSREAEAILRDASSLEF